MLKISFVTLYMVTVISVLHVYFFFMFCNLLWINEKGKEGRSVSRCVAIRFRLCWRHSDNLFVCFGAKPTQRARSPARPEVEEGRKVSEKTERVSWQRKAEENSRLEIAVWGRTRSTEGGSEKMEVEQRREPTEVRKVTAKTCWPTKAGLTNARRQSRDELGFLVACGSFAQIFTAIAYKFTESCTKVTLIHTK